MSHIEPKAPLDELDPGSRDPGYWERFHRTVMRAAAPGLARRVGRVPTVADVLSSWSRLLAPGAVAAAAVAGVLVMNQPDPNETQFPLVDVEELILTGWADEEEEPLEPLPAFFFLDEGQVDRDAVLLAANPF